MAELLRSVPGLIIALSIHEYAHGLVAFRLGDPTAARAGRLTLNPLAHIDPIGTLMLLFFRFGWAKPVPVNPTYFSDPRRGMLKVSAAGPAANIVAAFALSILHRTAIRLAWPYWSINVLILAVLYNVFLGVFNLLPVPPLDGSRILRNALPEGSAWWMDQLQAHGFLILLLLVFTGVIGRVVGPVAWFVIGLVQVLASLVVGA